MMPRRNTSVLAVVFVLLVANAPAHSATWCYARTIIAAITERDVAAKLSFHSVPRYEVAQVVENRRKRQHELVKLVGFGLGLSYDLGGLYGPKTSAWCAKHRPGFVATNTPWRVVSRLATHVIPHVD